MIQFKKLRYKNFLSSGNAFTEIDFERNKTTLIVGLNGAGKSTLLDALMYVLYGKPFRKILKPQLVNTITNKNLIVEIEFSTNGSEYKIVRGMKPSIFEIHKNGTKLNQDSTIRDQQDFFETTILKINPRAFSQIVVLGSANYVPFMELTAAARREVIEDLLDIQIFSLMHQLLKEDIQESKLVAIQIDNDIKNIEIKISLNKKHIGELKQNNDDVVKTKIKLIKKEESDIKDLTSGAKKIGKECSILESKISDASDISEKLSEIKTLTKRFKQKLNLASDELSFYENNEECPTCHQIIEDGLKKKRIDDLTEKSNQIRKAQNDVVKIQKKTFSRLAQITEIQDKINIFIADLNRMHFDISSKKSIIETHKNDIDLLKKKTKEVVETSDRTEKLKEQYNEVIEKKKELSKKKNIYALAGNLLKDGGIKGVIIKQYIPIVNQLVNKYLAAMDFFVQFEIDETFNEKILSRHRDDFSYQSFSEGEKFRINLALLFTWRAIAKLRNSASTNLLILDEIFDSSLDVSGTDEFMKIIDSISDDTNVFIISHKQDQLSDKFDHVIQFQKIKNFSKVIE